jgi:hypothetical protein
VGTSRNDRSPSTPPWKMALAVLGAREVSPDRQCTEIWRAVAADRGEKLLRDFSTRSLADACELAAAQFSPQEAVARFNELTRYESNVGLVVDMGRRAIARCAAEGGNATRFVSELFAEAVSYYASRDLPSYVAAPGRVATSSDSINLKEDLRRFTKLQVESVGEPRLGQREWRRYIAEIVNVLQSKGSTR